MKKAFLYTGLVLLPLLSCSVIAEDAVEEKDKTAKGGVEFVVKAVLAGSDDTKTAVQSDQTSIYWTVGDAINLFHGSLSSGQFTCSITEPSASAEFSGTLTGTDGGSVIPYWGVYPYDASNSCDGSGVLMTIPHVQSGVPGTFANHLNPIVATSADQNLTFYNVGSWFVFTLTQNDIVSVTLSSVAGESLVGRVRVEMDGDSRPAVSQIQSGRSSITMTPQGSDTFAAGEKYYMVLIPQTLSQGYRLTFTKADGSAAERVITGTKTFTRSQFRAKLEADSGVTYFHPVDLGLSVKWANVNIGASAPEESGDFYAWGEVSKPSNNNYSWSTYKWCKGSAVSFTKYCPDYSYGLNYSYWDLNFVLDPEDDVATVKLGGRWRMPTEQEMDDLRKKCNWTWTTLNGVNGYRVSSKTNENSIFLPVTGRRSDNQTLYSEDGFYWTSSRENVNNGDIVYAGAMDFYSGGKYYFSASRSSGLPVRPVYCDTDIAVSGVSILEYAEIELTEGHEFTLVPRILPELATNQAVSWSSSDESVAVVSSEGKVQAIATGSATVTVTTDDGGRTASCVVSVVSDSVPEYVDLGLSVKWATKNVGATALDGYGSLLGWGETSHSSGTYGWSTYVLCNGSGTKLTKYCNSSSYGNNGFTDGLLTLQPQDDAATTERGNGWRTPTSSEWKELTDNCEWKWIAHNGVRGFRIVSNSNGNSIFLPAAGYIPNDRNLYFNRECFYWLSSIDSGNPSQALCRILGRTIYKNVLDSKWARGDGMSVRPVYEGSF